VISTGLLLFTQGLTTFSNVLLSVHRRLYRLFYPSLGPWEPRRKNTCYYLISVYVHKDYGSTIVFFYMHNLSCPFMFSYLYQGLRDHGPFWHCQHVMFSSQYTAIRDHLPFWHSQHIMVSSLYTDKSEQVPFWFPTYHCHISILKLNYMGNSQHVMVSYLYLDIRDHGPFMVSS